MKIETRHYIYGLIVGLIAGSIMGIWASIGYAHFEGTNFLDTSCKVMICTENSGLCVGNTITYPEGVYKGNVGKVTDIYETTYGSYNITVQFCNGDFQSYYVSVNKDAE